MPLLLDGIAEGEGRCENVMSYVYYIHAYIRALIYYMKCAKCSYRKSNIFSLYVHLYLEPIHLAETFRTIIFNPFI